MTNAREATWLPWQMSRTFSLTRSQPRSLLSITRFEVEQREFTNALVHLKANAQRPDVLELERRLLADDLVFVPRLTMCSSCD